MEEYRLVHKIPMLSIALLLCLGLAFTERVTLAQGPTITPDGTMGTAVQKIGTDYLISQGTIRGSNQFHSFGKFSIQSDESATFTGPSSIENIIGRVTGGERSTIDGLLRSDIHGANLFLINPNGIVFGPHATLDISGSFHATTADYLKLSDGGVFYTDPAKNSVLTVAPPSAFGFLSNEPASISVQGSALEVPEGKTLSLIGGDIDITGETNGSVSAAGGKINLASVASEGKVGFSEGKGVFEEDFSSFDHLGAVRISDNAKLDVSGNGGGAVLIRGGRFVMDASSIKANVSGQSSGQSETAGIQINIDRDTTIKNGSSMESNVLSGVSEDSGGVRITAGTLEVNTGSFINSMTYWGSQGNSGPIEVTADTIILDEGGKIKTGTEGSGRGGDIIVNTGDLEISNKGLLISAASSGSGNGGDIKVHADKIVMSNEEYPGYLTGVSARSYGYSTGNAGDIKIEANELTMLPGTEISTPTWSLGAGGNIDVDISGKISITGTRAWTPNGIIIPTGFFANTFGPGNGGNVNISADSIDMTTEASIQVNTYYTGDAGNAKIDANAIEIGEASFISSTGYFGWKGNAGNVELNAGSILISGPESSMDPFRTDFTGISTSSSKWEGCGGNIHIEAESLRVTNRGTIEAIAWGPDPGGNIQIKAGDLDILNGANINVSTFASGDGGEIGIEASNVLISGVHPELFTDMAGRPSLSPSGIGSQATSSGTAGSINIATENLEILDGGRLTAETYGPGDAGKINVQADSVLVSGVNGDLGKFLTDSGSDPKWAGASILASTNSYIMGDDATGNGGDIRISASDIEIRNGGLISTETETPGQGGEIELTADNVSLLAGASIFATSELSPRAGKAGDINIDAENTFLSDNASIATAAKEAQGGDITLSAQDVQIVNHSSVSAKSSGKGDAGNILIKARTYTSRDSTVTTEAEKADGGNICVFSQYMVHLVESSISASVGGGPTTVGGNIAVDPDFVILKGSKIIANAYEGRGGNIRITSGVFLADPDSVVDASSQLGINGTVDIRSPVTSVSETVSPLAKDFISAAELLRQRCRARLFKGKYSSFIVEGRDGLPVEPGDLLPSPL